MCGKYVVAKVFRYNPATDQSPIFKVYKVPWREKLTVLEVLRYINDNIEPISFRYSCRSGMCGRCGVQVDGEPKLACTTLVEPGKQIVIEPLRGFPIVKDLAVNISDVEQRDFQTAHYLQRVTLPTEQPETITYKSHQLCSELMKCRSCYLCQSACPVVNLAWGRFSGPTIRTKLALRAYDPRDDEGYRLRQLVREGLWLCSTCLKCEEVCPVGIDIMDLTVKNMREMIVAKGLHIPDGYRRLVEKAVKTGRILEPEKEPLLMTSPDLIKVKDPVLRVGFFTGCMFDYMFQNAAKAALRVLERNSVEIVLPKEQVCCGMPMFLSGQSKVAEQFVKQNVKVFEDANVDIVITMCSSCIAAWRKYVPKVAEQILGRQPKFEVLDIHDFLVNKVSLDARGMVQITDKVTYHDPCHLKRGAGIYKEPRMLIKMIPGIEFVEMREADKCCGGFLRFNEPQLANRIGEVKGELIRDSEANTVTTACPLCVSQLRIITKKIGLQNIEVLNVIELLERAYLVNK